MSVHERPTFSPVFRQAVHLARTGQELDATWRPFLQPLEQEPATASIIQGEFIIGHSRIIIRLYLSR